MRKVLCAAGLIGLAAFSLSHLTNHDYLWSGMRETWFRGWENPQIDDFEFREYVRRIPASSNPQPWPKGSRWGRVELSAEAESWHVEHQSASFLVIHDDSLVLETYYRGHDATTLTNSFSMAKSITAMAAGLAVGRGLVDEQALLSTYIPRFAEGSGATLKVQEVLQMRSGITFGESYKNPFGFQAKAYFRENNRDLLMTCRPSNEPGTLFDYQGGNTMLLAEMLDVVREGNLASDIADNLWGQMGAEHDAFWGLDGNPESGAVERAIAQFYATTRDYARFGQMILDTGAWKGKQLLDKAYATRMITPQNQLSSDVDADFYGYQIWLGRTDDGRAFSMMEGLRGQMIISVPSLRLVVVRTGYYKSQKNKRQLPVECYDVIEMARALL